MYANIIFIIQIPPKSFLGDILIKVIGRYFQLYKWQRTRCEGLISYHAGT